MGWVPREEGATPSFMVRLTVRLRRLHGSMVQRHGGPDKSPNRSTIPASIPMMASSGTRSMTLSKRPETPIKNGEDSAGRRRSQKMVGPRQPELRVGSKIGEHRAFARLAVLGVRTLPVLVLDPLRE